MPTPMGNPQKGMRTIPCQAGGNLLEGISLELQKTIARRFIKLGIHMEKAFELAGSMREGSIIYIIRDDDDHKPTIIIKLTKE